MSFVVTSLKYLPKDYLIYIILVIYLETDLSEKFNLNLNYILIKALDFDNQDNTLYKTSYQKLMDILLSNNFLITNSGDKLYGLVLGEMASN